MSWFGKRHPVDNEITVRREYSPAEKVVIAEKHGVSPKFVSQRIREREEAKGCFKIVSIITLVLAIMSLIIYYNTGLDENPPIYNPTNRDKYEELSVDGKSHVDEQMKKYDEFCAKSLEC